MINLNNHEAFREIDREDMLSEIDGLPEQLRQALELGNAQTLPAWEGIRQVVITGMGGSAIGADLLAAYAERRAGVPIFVNRNYNLPAWARARNVLVVASSHSGNTEETLSAFEQAVENDCLRLAVTTGGKLAERALETDTPVWRFEHAGQPRAAVGYSFGLLLAILSKLGILTDRTAEVEDAVAAMQKQQENLRAEVPTAQNPAKRMAGQLIDRWVVVMGSEILEPVARRWKGQISEVAKAWAQFEFLPEADHNTLAGITNPESVLSRTTTLFLRAGSYHPRNRLRSDLTRQAFMLEGLSTDFFDAQGETPLAQMWTTLHFGDYLAYYLAMAYQVDPTPVASIEGFKDEMKRAGQ